MANRVEYAVSVTPVRTIAAVSGKYAAQDVIEGDINKTLGGSDSVVTGSADISVTGFTAGAVAYGNCPVSGGSELVIAANDACDMLFIKHTGYQWGGNATTLGDASTSSIDLIVKLEYSDGNFKEFCRISPGGAIALPKVPDLGSGMGFGLISSGSETIAVEYAVID
tara:strand:- start:5869 stop:6369 length:501 start_codon:yes stop_codon:yes gene_type:complete